MPLLTPQTVPAALAVEVGPGVVSRLPAILQGHGLRTGGRTAVVLGHGVGASIEPLIRQSIAGAEIMLVAAGRFDDAASLRERLRACGCEIVIGIGGGRVIDTVKYAAAQQDLPMVAVATSLAHDGFASPVSVLDRDGVSVSCGARMPALALVDTDFVRKSPPRQLRSGIGDALSNLSAVADWELAHQTTGEPIDGLAVALARTGAEAVLFHPAETTEESFIVTLANALLLGGVAMAVAGSSRPCSGGCHEISHAITRLYPGAGTHGEQVGVGTLFCAWLRGLAQFPDLVSTFTHRDLPRVPSDLGLSTDQFAAAVALAPETRPGRYTIIEHLALDEPAIRRNTEAFIEAVTKGGRL
ncbi:MAG: iron-containing alcohol dehydrogenase family protein [Micromonosporaceae bacterium]|nr:iron-containing alcohol dehydrogenase family protein [Micromonosporaceae bacterium]